MNKISRRQFMKKTIVMGTAIAAFPTVISRESRARTSAKVVVHPNIDNLRVVGITDTSMTKGHEPGVPWANQDKLVVSKAVGENIDKLACGLAETGNPAEAWRTIFIKPPRKSWTDTVVAIKTNNIAQQHTRSAVMAKVCHTLTRIMGVNPHNIHIYDACHGDSIKRKSPFYGLPEGCRVENEWGGSTTYTAIPKPWKDGKDKSKCLKHLVDGSVDILINIALCKGHSERFGGFTSTMKNHFGTFSPGPGHRRGSEDYLIAINRTPEILGTMDKQTGKVLFPRQQLCLVDALWASKRGPGGNPSHQPNFLAMGVLSPIVDFQLATKFRGKKMGWRPNMKMARRMLTEFGYAESDLPEGGKLIEI
ncbi:MAG: DUF362 domain-containing protein [Desulfobacteraceae bacterium]|nr:MAG: DUF362 domain-containing protein [Desulfobacteraceae bacterium]